MVQRHYTIRKAFLVVLGLDSFLLFCLLLISLLTESDTMEKLILMLFFLPALVLFLECLFRRVTVAEEGLVVRKLGRSKALSWDDITRVGTLILRKKVYLLLTTVKGFFVISNAYGNFSGLVEDLVARVEPERVEEDVRLQEGRSLTGIANIVTAWFAAVLMMTMILMKLLPVVV